MSEFVMNVEAYLNRLGLSGPMEPTEENLCLITRAHLVEVPFENLQVMYEHTEPSLTAEDLFRKVVENKRGGWCFELNKLFYLLLVELGYDCTAVPCRIIFGREEKRPVTHRATVVRVNGHKWMVDVGYGGAGPKGAIRLDTREIQNIYGDDFYVTDYEPRYPGELIIFRIDDGVHSPVLTHREIPWTDEDFSLLNGYFATYPRSPFKLKRVLYRCTPCGWVNMVDCTFTQCIDGNRQIVELQTEEQIQEVIEQHFRLFVKPD